MRSRIYPYTAWLLTRNYEPVEVELVGQGYLDSTHDRTDAGRNLHVNELFSTKDAAIAHAENKLAEMAENLIKRQAWLQRCQTGLQRYK